LSFQKVGYLEVIVKTPGTRISQGSAKRLETFSACHMPDSV